MKTKLNWWEYWIGHCWMTGWQSIRMNFRMWADLMGSNYADYALPRTVEDPWNLQPRQPIQPVKKPQQHPVEGFE